MSISLTCPLTVESESVKQFSVQIHDTIAAVDAFHWNKFIPQSNLLMQADYLSMLEETQQGNMRFKYALVKRDNLSVGVIYFQIVKFEAAQLINYFPEGNSFTLSSLRKMSSGILSAINATLLVSGNTFMTGENGFYFKQDIDHITRGKILRKTIREICALDSTISAVLLSDLYMPKTDFDSGFLEQGFREITVESDMSIVIKPEWKSFNDYLQSLSSKYRVRAKKVYSLCNENHVRTLDMTLSDIELHQDRIFDLYGKVMKKADFKLSGLTLDYFRKQKALMPDAYKLFAYFKDDVMIGFISAFVLGKRMEVHYVGMDHDICKPIHLYQHMMYDMIALGISAGVDKLHFGRTAPEIKSTIGAVPSPMYGYLKHLNPMVNLMLVKPYTANLKPKQYTFRNPFKD
ncbi:MAG: GNAT family N-acetyltransferase [Bacteroidetes bacterium]|nr:GNAT family N-acetyltransferase [Bacteroidota bacterium]